MSEQPIPIRDETPLVVSHVSKRFEDVEAVSDVSLEIRPGEIFALLGPNGAGKSTLINCICGLARQTAGSIRVFGYDTLADFRLTRRLIGLVPQEINFDPFFTPLESLVNQMGFMGVEPSEARALELLETFALLDKKSAYTRQLSGGMKRRLLVAKALVHDPKLIFLDEPTAGVDVELRQDLWREVRKLRDRGATIILTTHYLEEAEELADRIGIIHRGRLLLVEERDKLMARYQQKRVRIELASNINGKLEELQARGAQVEGRVVTMSWDSPDELTGILDTLHNAGDPVDVQLQETRLEDIFVDLIRAADRNNGPAAD